MPAHAALHRRARSLDKSDLQRLQDRIERFQKSRFPDQTVEAKLKHLRAEVTKWLNATEDETEMADVFILALAVATQLGYTTSNIVAIANRKMAVNEKREWHAPDANGVCHHVET